MSSRFSHGVRPGNLSMLWALAGSLACGAPNDDDKPAGATTTVVTTATTTSTLTATDTSTATSNNSTLGLGNNAAPFANIDQLPPTAGTVAIDFALKLSNAQGIPIAAVAQDDLGNSYAQYAGPGNLSSYFPSSTGSLAGCETLNYARGVFGFLGNADRTMCVASKPVGDKINDTNFKIYSATLPSNKLVKLRIRKIVDGSGKIKAVEAMMCQGSTTSQKQTQYMSWDFSGEKVVIHMRGIETPDNPDVTEVNFEATITADGVTEAGQLKGSKKVDMSYQNLFANGRNNHVVSSSTQTPTELTINHASCERENLTADCDASRSHRILSHMAIFDNNPSGKQSPNLLGIGAGAAYIQVGGAAGVQQWNASALTDNATQSTAGTKVRSLKESIKNFSKNYTRVAFSEAQAWDCAGEAAALDLQSTLMQECARLAVDQNVYLQCGQANLNTAIVP